MGRTKSRGRGKNQAKTNVFGATNVNRKVKDRLFRLVFSDKKDLLELYNAVNNSHCLGIRYLLLCCSIIGWYMNIQILQNTYIFIAWMVLTYIEFLWTDRKDISKYAEITIHTAAGNKQTKNKVIDYGEDKVKYNLLDGTEEIIEKRLIEKITYSGYHLVFKKDKRKTKVMCTFIDNKQLEFGNHNRVGGSWERFSSLSEGVMKVEIYPLRTIQTIRTENL